MSDTLVPIEGSVPTNAGKLIGPLDPKERIDLTVTLRRKSEAGLPSLDEFIAGKRVRLTRQQLADRYGAKQEDADVVRSWATKQGLSVEGVDLGLRQMHLAGTADVVSHAFGTKLSAYEHQPTHRRYRFPEQVIRIPENLSGIIRGVFGLNTMPVVRRRRHVRRRDAARANADPVTAFPGSFYPHQVAALYNFPPNKGSGQRVAILEFGGGFDPQVVDAYFRNNIGLQTPPKVNSIPLLNAVPDVRDGATGEVYLDIEVVGGMAPASVIDVYFAPWTGQGYLKSITQAIHDYDYAAISISYGLDEDVAGSTRNPGWTLLHQNIDEAFRDAAAVGVPVFVSSGDQGSSSLRSRLTDGEDVTVFSNTAHAAYPATSPYATAVGGTMLYTKGGAIETEVVWNELCELQQSEFYYGGATGGGVSDRYPTPSYQSGVAGKLQSANPGGKTGRGIPDVAGNAGSTTGYLVSQPPDSQDPIAPVGGTSAAAPMWAALMACVREALAARFNGKIPIYFFNDFVYATGNTSAFRDIVGGRKCSWVPGQGVVPGDLIPIGNNRSTKVDAYNASKGFDLCTGWGSPNGKELLAQLGDWLAAQPPA
jgi:kumamolisin